MANINEAEEKSEYSDEAFEEEDEAPKEEEVERIPRVTVKQVSNGLGAVRILLMIKKVPRTHMVKYLLKGEALPKDEQTGEEVISNKTLTQIFERKFNFGNSKATKLARFFVEGPPMEVEEEDADPEIEDKDHSTNRETLIHRFKQHVSHFNLYNSMAVEHMLSRLQGIMSGKETDFLDDLNLDDEDSNGYLPFEQI